MEDGPLPTRVFTHIGHDSRLVFTKLYMYSRQCKGNCRLHSIELDDAETNVCSSKWKLARLLIHT